MSSGHFYRWSQEAREGFKEEMENRELKNQLAQITLLSITIPHKLCLPEFVKDPIL